MSQRAMTPQETQKEVKGIARTEERTTINELHRRAQMFQKGVHQALRDSTPSGQTDRSLKFIGDGKIVRDSCSSEQQLRD